MRTASAFGELIIAIVYLPVLALTSTEGKLFRPMAITVLLALAGAFILSVTLVPVLASLFVRPRSGHEETWLIRKVHALYVPLFRKSMQRRTLTVGLGVIALAAPGAVLLSLAFLFGIYLMIDGIIGLVASVRAVAAHGHWGDRPGKASRR